MLATLSLPKVASLAGIGLQPKVQHDVQPVIPKTCRTLWLRSSSPPVRVMRCMLTSDQLCTCTECRRMLALCLSCNSMLYLGGGHAQMATPPAAPCLAALQLHSLPAQHTVFCQVQVEQQVENRLLYYLNLAKHCVLGCFGIVRLHGTVAMPHHHRDTPTVTTPTSSARAKQHHIRIDIMRVALDVQ